MRGTEPGNDNKNGEDLPTERGDKREEGVYGGSSYGDFPGGQGLGLCASDAGDTGQPLAPELRSP